MKLISLEDDYSANSDLALTPLYPAKAGCNSCGKKGININITNTANGNTASGNSGSNANNDNLNTQRSSHPQARNSDNGWNIPAVKETQPVVESEPRPADKTETLLNKILAKLNEPRPAASSIATEKKPDNVKTIVKEREVRYPVERKVNYVTEKPVTIERERQVPYVKNQEVTVPRERIKTEIIEREIPRVFDRIKNKVLVIRANQPPAPPSFA